VFAATAATIVSGSMAERTKFLSYCIYSVVITALIYRSPAHWIWGGGWLAQLGFHDFAGSTAVHMVGGIAALIGAKMLAPASENTGPTASPRRSWPQHHPGRAGRVHPVVRLVWVQPGLHAQRHRRRRAELDEQHLRDHQPGGGGRRHGGDDRHLVRYKKPTFP
jgi:hypothetical protein